MGKPVLGVDVLPPSRNHANVIPIACVLLLVNPAVFPFCWQSLWEPFLLVCVFERVVFILGLSCLGWTLMTVKVLELGVKCGCLLCSCSMRRMSRRAGALPQTMIDALNSPCRVLT